MTDPVDFLLRAAMRLPRPDIARLTEGLIAGLDVLDGDPDLEPEQDHCLAGDDGCAPVWRNGRRHWGSEWDEQPPDQSHAFCTHQRLSVSVIRPGRCSRSASSHPPLPRQPRHV